MSAGLFDLGLRLRARAEQRPVLRAGAARCRVRDGGLLVAVAAMPGDHAGLWAAAVSEADGTGRPKTVAVGDPRDWKQQERLWADLWPLLSRATVRCEEAGTAPQIVVASRPAAELLEAASSRFIGSDNDDARRSAELVQFVCQRSMIAGSQTLVVATEALAAHVTTGGEAADEHRLGVLLAWVHATDPADLAARLAALDSDIDGDGDDTHTPVDLDRGDLGKKVEALVKAAARSPQMVETRAMSVRKILTGLLVDRHARLAAAAAAVNDLGLPAMGDLAGFAADDLDAWAQWQSSRDAGYRVARRDRPARAAVALTEREEAVDLWERALIWSDPIERARQATEGRVIDGTADGTWGVTCDGLVRARPGDEFVLYTLDRDGPTVTIVGLDNIGSGTVVHATTAANAAPPPAGTPVQLCPPPPDFGAARRARIRTARRVRQPHWTHHPDQPAPPPQPHPDPFTGGDPLDAARALRAG